MQFIFAVLQFFGTLLLVLLVFNLIILVHEVGHFLAAKWRGLKIEKFQIWFGRAIWKKTINGVQYGLGSIPAGGFVALPQMAPMDMIEGATEDSYKDLPKVSALDKIIVAFAGPLFSFGLAVFFAFVVWGVGYPEPASDNSPVIGYVAEDFPAAEAGLQVGDEILEVDNRPVETFSGMVDSVTWNIVSSEGESIDFKVLRDGKEMVIPVQPQVGDEKWAEKHWLEKWFHRPPTRKVGIGPMEEKIRVGRIMPHGPAEEAGIQVGDHFLTMNGEAIPSSGVLEDRASELVGQPVTFTLERLLEGELGKKNPKTEIVTVQLTPRVPEKEGSRKKDPPVIGVFYGSDDPIRDGLVVSSHPTPTEQITRTFRVMYNTITSVANPNSDISIKHLSGPVGIIDLYYRLFHTPEGWKQVLWFSVVLNINLALLNLLPLPVLDGGHIVMALVESLRGRPISRWWWHGHRPPATGSALMCHLNPDFHCRAAMARSCSTWGPRHRRLRSPMCACWTLLTGSR